jgi:large subunit ribosomal protein L29
LRAIEFRAMDKDELDAKLRELKEALFNLRFQHATGQLDNPMRIKEARRDIARVCTVITERKYAIRPEAFEEAMAMPLVEPRDLEEPEEIMEMETEAEPEEDGASPETEITESGDTLEEEVDEELRDL